MVHMSINDSQHDEIMQSYYQHQTENRALEKERKEEIYDKIPRIAEIDRIIAQSSIDAIRNRLTSGTDDSTATKERNHALIAEKKDLLKTHGYDTDYLEPIYTCPICKDTGLIDNAYCNCYKQASISLRYKQSTLKNILKSENFEHFDLSYYPKESDGNHPFTPYDNMKNILDKTKQFVTNFESEGGNLLFYGETGLGKTFLSHCIAKELLDKRCTVLYQSSIQLFDEVCANAVMKKSPSASSEEMYRYLFDCDLLIIDDLGTEYTNSFVSSELYNILNTRMRNGKSTIISTNLNLMELTDRYSDRTSTRIFAEYKVFNFYGDNIRLVKRRNAMGTV